MEKLQSDPHWRDHLLFHKNFHADTGAGLGANHQTGWTALVASPHRRVEKITAPPPPPVVNFDNFGMNKRHARLPHWHRPWHHELGTRVRPIRFG